MRRALAALNRNMTPLLVGAVCAVMAPILTGALVEHPARHEYAPNPVQWQPWMATAFPGCREWHEGVDGKPGTDIPTSLIVVGRSGEQRRMSLDEGWRRHNTPSEADDVWTIGGCWDEPQPH